MPFLLEHDYDGTASDDPRWEDDDWEPPLVSTTLQMCLLGPLTNRPGPFVRSIGTLVLKSYSASCSSLNFLPTSLVAFVTDRST